MDNRDFRQRSGVLMLGIAFLFGGPWLIWSTRSELRQAMAAYQALAAAPTAEYQVAGRAEEVRGAGKSRSVHYFLQLGPRDGAAATVTVEVSRPVYQGTPNGTRWKARLAAGQPRFDPLDTRFELDRSRNMSYVGSAMFFGAILLLWLHRSGRLYRAL